MAEQEARGGKILPAFFVEPIALGDTFKSGEWPAHMTYFPPVQTLLNPQQAEQLRRYVNPMEPFMAEVGEPTKLGPNEDIPAHLMIPSKRLLAVHRRIKAVYQHLPHSDRFLPYNPHMTDVEGGARVETGDSIEVGGFSIAEKLDRSDTWRIVAKIGLKGAQMTTDARIIKKSERTE